MYKRLGLGSEQVCELGKWKNVQAFTDHYLRLGAAESAGNVLTASLDLGVHNVSPRECADSKESRTPPREPEGGGRDSGGEAQDTGLVSLREKFPSTLPSEMVLVENLRLCFDSRE